jgi:hypothetical protein
MAESGWNTCEACRTYQVHENNELCIESFRYSRHNSVLLSDTDPADPERLARCVSPKIRCLGATLRMYEEGMQECCFSTATVTQDGQLTNHSNPIRV